MRVQPLHDLSGAAAREPPESPYSCRRKGLSTARGADGAVVDASFLVHHGHAVDPGVDARRPIICQVCRFDAWNDPLGVIDAYKLAKRGVPELQLVLVAAMLVEDSETVSYYERCARRAGEDADVHLLSMLNNIGNTEVNVFQRASRVVVQKSIRKGFGLGIAEALWKGRPVVAGRVGGFPLQVTDGVTGYLVDTVAECAEKIVFLIQHPAVADRMGRAGREQVRSTLPITRCLRNYLELFDSIR